MGPKTYEDAREDCKFKGGKLPLPKTDAMNTEIVNKARAEYELADSPSLPDANVGIWIDVVLESESEPALGYTNWRDNTPNDLKHAPVCVRINTRGSHAYKWDDKDCKAKVSYICEIEG